jgi:hypothetical protein
VPRRDATMDSSQTLPPLGARGPGSQGSHAPSSQTPGIGALERRKGTDSSWGP